MKKSGFTLIELILAIAIFMIFLLVATNSYLSIVRAQKSANETRIMYSELRSFIDLVNEEMRDGMIDYVCYEEQTLFDLGESDSDINDFFSGDLTRCRMTADLAGMALTFADQNNLRIISKDGLRATLIAYNPEGKEVLVQRSRRVAGGSSAWISGEPENVGFANLEVEDLRFSIFPLKNPQKLLDNGRDLSNQFQPGVTVNIEVKSKNALVFFDLNFQTFISSRNYN